MPKMQKDATQLRQADHCSEEKEVALSMSPFLLPAGTVISYSVLKTLCNTRFTSVKTFNCLSGLTTQAEIQFIKRLAASRRKPTPRRKNRADTHTSLLGAPTQRPNQNNHSQQTPTRNPHTPTQKLKNPQKPNTRTPSISNRVLKAICRKACRRRRRTLHLQ